MVEKHDACFQSICSQPGGGGTRPIFEYSWAAEGLKPCPSLGQKIPKIHTLFKTTRSILVPCLWPNALLIIRTDSQKSCTLFRTELCEIIYPVQAREDKNHTLSSGISPDRPYKGVPSLPGPIFTDFDGSDTAFIERQELKRLFVAFSLQEKLNLCGNTWFGF